MATIEICATGEITTGTIVHNIPWSQDGVNIPGIVLSNACDLEHDKAGYIIIAGLVEAKTTLLDSNEYKNLNITPRAELSSKDKVKLKRFYEDYIYNKGITRYYLIYPNKALEASMPAMLVDFQHLTSIPSNESNRLRILAELKSPFREEMMQHFTSYTSRVPVPREESSVIFPLLTDYVL